MFRLIIHERQKDSERTYECMEASVTLGRQETNTIVLPSVGVSRQHADITVEDGKVLLRDLGSGNGTKLNGRPITPHEKHLLRHQDVITIDQFDLRFEEHEAKWEEVIDEEATGSDIVEIKLLKTVLAALDQETAPSLEVLNGVDEGKKVSLTDDMPEIIVGRDPHVGFPVREQVISRQHAKILKRWGGICIRDLDSKNGTFINNRRIVEEYLHDGDRIALGTIVFLFRNPQEFNIAELEAKSMPRKPLPVMPKDIPLVPPLPEKNEELPKEKEEQSESATDAVSEWEKLEKDSSPKRLPPPPKTMLKLSPLEIGMMGLGSLVLIFALITLVNLLMA